jgi:hypothetical protein
MNREAMLLIGTRLGAHRARYRQITPRALALSKRQQS